MNIPCTTHKVTPLILVTLQVNGKDLMVELDTGATLSIVSEKTYQSLFSVYASPQLKTSKAKLKNLHRRGSYNIGRDKCEC